MPKDAYYFSHDSNARHDPKILKMRSVYKLEGLGLYWALIEMMREQEDYLLPIDNGSVEGYALDLHCTSELLNSFIDDCIQKFNLFQNNNNYIWSDSLLRRMSKFDDKADKAREAANIRWGKTMQTQSERNTDAMRTQCGGNASKVKYSKVKYSKIKETKIPDFINQELWDDFMDMRTKKRIPNTDRAKKLLISRLTEFKTKGYDANKIIENSIVSGWTGVFEPKYNGAGKDGTYRQGTRAVPKPEDYPDAKDI